MSDGAHNSWANASQLSPGGFWVVVPKAGIEWEETGIQGSLFWLWAKANKQRLDLLLVFGAAAAAADQPSFRGLAPFCLAPLRSAAKRGIYRGYRWHIDSR